MVSWWADGGISGYSSQFQQSLLDQYVLATPGMINVNGVTRQQYNYPASEPNTTKGRFTARAYINFTSGDYAANPGKRMTASMFMAPATAFAPGVTPTVAQMLALGAGLVVARASSTYSTTGDKTLTIRGPQANLMAPNTKYWVLIMPTAVDPATSPSTVNDKIPNGVTAAAMGRGLSMWTNRTAAKPIITSPASGSVFDPGDIEPLSFTSADPDNVSGFTPTANNKDIAGVEVQYAARPTPDNPNPVWQGIHDYLSDVQTSSGWYILGSTNASMSEYLEDLRLNQTIGLVMGKNFSNDPDDLAIPAGDWQIRLRTFDFGHPDPLFYNPLMRADGAYTPSTYPAINTSPWSDPVLISIPTQTPPPIAISPRDSRALGEDDPVILKWQYRNTASPPLPQAFRQVQIRPVGSTDWVTVASDPSPETELDLSLWGPLGTPLKSWTWESAGAGVDGWAWLDSPPTVGSTLARSTADFHSGVASLRALNADPDVGNAPGIDLISWAPAGSIRGLDFWVKTAGSSGKTMWVILFNDVSDDLITFVAGLADTPTNVWSKVESVFQVPVNAASAQLYIQPNQSNAAMFIDDVRVGTPDPYTNQMEATTQYEWQVFTADEDAMIEVFVFGDNSKLSNWSSPARFWIVPEPDSGSVLPLPAETIEGATLGCGTHRIFIYRRGGLERVGEITKCSYIDWSRVRDDISTAKVIVSDWDIDCGNLLSQLQTWAYEMVIYRDNGQTIDRVWEGPLTLLTYEEDKVTLNAKDVMGYSYRRIIKQAMNNAGKGNGDTVVNRAKKVLQNTFAPDDPNVLQYMQVIANVDDPMQYRSTPAYSRTAFEEVDDMAANAGLDYTAIGRSIVLWSTRRRIGLLPEFRDEDLGNSPIVSEYGMSMANRYAISDGNGVWGEATRLDANGEDPIYGLVEMLSSSWASDSEEESGTYTQEGLQTIRESFEASAERSISDRYGPPVVVRIPDNTTINPDAPISIQQLVPGVAIPLRSTKTLRTVVGTQKVDSIKVIQQSTGETVTITLSPFNREDDNAEVVEE